MGTLPRSLQELEHIGRWRTVPAEDSELPTVSGARVGAGTGRLVSVNRVASSQEPEPSLASGSGSSSPLRGCC